MQWRRLNHAAHRDLGYLCIGLTLIYAISGLAVNHIRDWNPNYRIEKETVQIQPVAYRGIVPPEMLREILRRLGETESYENSFQPDPESVWIYVDNRMIRAHLPTGLVEHEKIVRRPFFHALNYLHLNHPKRGWTWIGDLYAAALAPLAITGLLMLPRNGPLRRRGLLLAFTGTALPAVCLLIFY